MNRLIFAAAIVTLSCTGPKEAVAPDSGVVRDGGPTTPSDAGATSDGGETLDIGPACGNGRIEPGETCDDANAVAGDGCSSLCELERGRIELAQSTPRAEVDQPILIRGEGFRYATELQVCIVQAEACRFTIGTVQTDAFGVIEADSGEGAAVRIDQAMAVSVAVCDPTIETCSNTLALEWFVPDVECQEDYDCAEGLRCLGNQCIADSPSCSSDREVIECPPGQVCVNGLCEDPNENHCQDSSDCPDEHNCINGRCIERNRQCGEHDHCPMHQLCDLNRGQCQGLPAGMCRDDSPCQLHCVVPAGEQLGRCVDCEQDDECPVGAVCNQLGQCAAPNCTPDNCPAPGRCENDRCVGGGDCNPQNCQPPNRCENNNCVNGQAPQLCAGHDDCDPTMQCLVIDNRGTCVSRCNQGDQAEFCAGGGQPNCICNMLTMTCDHRTGLCER